MPKNIKIKEKIKKEKYQISLFFVVIFFLFQLYFFFIQGSFFVKKSINI